MRIRFLVLVLSLAGCGGDEPVAASCSGSGCMCSADNMCSCAVGSDCAVTCGACALVCNDAKCNITASGAVDLTCQPGSDCKGNAGDESRLVCSGDSKCELKGGARSTGTCSGSADCKFNVGEGSTVSCAGTASCDVKCDGSCAVTCTTSARCSCSGGCEIESCPAAMTCADGSLICNGSC